MSVVLDRLGALKQQLSALSTAHIQSIPSEEVSPPSSPSSSLYLTQLHSSVSILSSTTHTKPSLEQIVRLIIEVNKAKIGESEEITQTDYAKELEWLFLARCTIDAYGCILEQLFQQTLPLARDIFYWEDILSQPHWRALFLIQTSPHRFFEFGRAAWQNTLAHLQETHAGFSIGTLRASLFDRRLFRRMAFPLRLHGALGAMDTSLDSLCRTEIEMKLGRLQTLRKLQAAGLGLLVSDGINFTAGRSWKDGVVRGVDMMKSTMELLQDVDVEIDADEIVDEGIRSTRHANIRTRG